MTQGKHAPKRVIDGRVEKRCTKCGKWKPATVDYFYRKGESLQADCKDCRKRGVARWYYANTEKDRERAIRWRANNLDKYKAQSLQYRENNREKIRMGKRRYRDEHPDAALNSERRWREANPDKLRKKNRQYREANREKMKAHFLRYRARKSGLPETFTGGEWLRCLEYWQGCCAICGRPPGLWHTLSADHWIPISYDGDDNPGTVAANIVPLCHGVGGCNNSKHNKLPTDWLIETYGKRKAREIMKRVQDYFDWVTAQDIEVAAD